MPLDTFMGFCEALKKLDSRFENGKACLYIVKGKCPTNIPALSITLDDGYVLDLSSKAYFMQTSSDSCELVTRPGPDNTAVINIGVPILVDYTAVLDFSKNSLKLGKTSFVKRVMPEDPKSSHTGVIVTVVVILLLIAAVAVGFFLWRRK